MNKYTFIFLAWFLFVFLTIFIIVKDSIIHVDIGPTIVLGVLGMVTIIAAWFSSTWISTKGTILTIIFCAALIAMQFTAVAQIFDAASIDGTKYKIYEAVQMILVYLIITAGTYTMWNVKLKEVAYKIQTEPATIPTELQASTIGPDEARPLKSILKKNVTINTGANTTAAAAPITSTTPLLGRPGLNKNRNRRELTGLGRF